MAEECGKAAEASAEALLHAFEEANRKVLRAANGDPTLFGMGTTLTAGWRLGNEMLLANVGDSRAYVIIEGQLTPSPTTRRGSTRWGGSSASARRRLRTHPMRHVLTMAIGVGDALRVQSYAIPLRPEPSSCSAATGCTGWSIRKLSPRF